VITHGGIARRHGWRAIARRQDWRAIALAALIGTAASACGNDSPTTDPKQAIADAVKAWNDAGSVRVNATMVLDGAVFGGAMEMSGTGTLTGEATWSESLASRSALDVSMDSSESIAFGASGESVKQSGPEKSRLEMLFVDGVMYQRGYDENGGNADFALDGKTYPVELPAGNKWVAVDIDSLGANTTDPIAALGSEMLENLPDVTYAGRDDLDGLATRKFRASGGLEILAGVMGGTTDGMDPLDSSSTVLLWLDNDDQLVQLIVDAELSLGFDAFGAAFEQLGEALACDSEGNPTGSTEPTTTSKAERKDDDEKNVGTFMSMRMTERLRFSDYGTTVTIEAPTKTTTVDNTDTVRTAYQAAKDLATACDEPEQKSDGQ
jgi:hypothetical protein